MSINSDSSRSTFWRDTTLVRLRDHKISSTPLNIQSYDFDGNIYVKIDKVAIVINKESGKNWDPLNAKVNSMDGTKIQEIKIFT